MLSSRFHLASQAHGHLGWKLLHAPSITMCGVNAASPDIKITDWYKHINCQVMTVNSCCMPVVPISDTCYQTEPSGSVHTMVRTCYSYTILTTMCDSICYQTLQCVHANYQVTPPLAFCELIATGVRWTLWYFFIYREENYNIKKACAELLDLQFSMQSTNFIQTGWHLL
jgi:hypothetical protein